MKTLILDFETFYSDEYNLDKMTTEEYVRDKRFEALCVAWQVVGSPTEGGCARGPRAVHHWIKSIDWSQTAVVMHHAHFDGFILSEHFEARPAFFFDTMSMARAVYGPMHRVSLAKLAERYDLPMKTVPYQKFIGERWDQLGSALQDELCSGCAHDVELTETIFHILRKGFPRDELVVIDATIKMYTNPVLIGDAELFEQIAYEEEQRKSEQLERLNVTEKVLQSAAMFTKLLASFGEDVPSKAGKDGPIPCVAKSDPYMLEGMEREDVVGDLIRARLDVRSTLTESRAVRLARMSSRGPLPVYHGYFRATTGRWGGGEKVNIQNLPKKGRMRSGISAPEGHKLVVLDFSSIEYMILVALAGQTDIVEMLGRGEKPYCTFGTKLFEHEVKKSPPNEEYDFSKKVVLSCGYGTGKDKCAKQAVTEGFSFAREVTDKAIDVYRNETHPKVVELWGRLDKALPAIAAGKKCHLPGTPVRFENHALQLPNGQKCRFDLVWCDEIESWMRRTNLGGGPPGESYEKRIGQGYTKWWGGGVTQFICQSFARLRLSDLIVKSRNLGLVPPVFLVHDEYVAVAEDNHADYQLERLLEVAKEPAAWWENGPPWGAEGHVCSVYGK